MHGCILMLPPEAVVSVDTVKMILKKGNDPASSYRYHTRHVPPSDADTCRNISRQYLCLHYLPGDLEAYRCSCGMDGDSS